MSSQQTSFSKQPSPPTEGSQPPFDHPRRYPTDSSLYSCSELEANDPERHLRASDVRRQVQQAPNKRQRVPPPPPAPGSAPARSYLSKYPETFKDKEKTKGLQSKTPRKEYPIIPGPGNWVPGVSGTADKVRAVYNNNDRTTFDVVYHDVKKSSNAFENFSVANYRPARPQGT